MTQIYRDTLKDLIGEEGVSDNELEVLDLALNGKSPAEIKTILGRQSENAVQKTLSRIYTKFRITGAGPGKLSKLQKIISDRLQAKQGRRKILIAWAGSNSKYQAERIRDVIFKHPQIETFILDIDESSRSAWLQETEQILSKVDFSILCLPNECLEQAWVHFLVGLFSGKLHSFRLLRFSKKVNFETPIPFLSIDGTEKKNLAYLLHEITGGELQEAKDWIDYKLSASNWFKELIEEDLNSLPPSKVSQKRIILNSLEPILKNHNYLQNNKIFQQLVTNDIADIDERIEDFISNGSVVYSMPLELYPRRLTILQQKLKARVKAVAIVDGVESFWASDKGDEVAKTAHPESERLFVFSSEQDFERSLNFLLRHASYYKVFVTTKDIYIPYAEEFSLRDIATICNIESFNFNLSTLPTKEYAIIETDDGKNQLIAWYDNDNIRQSRSIRLANFSPKVREIEQYKKVLSNFLARASRNEGVFQVTVQNSIKKVKTEKGLDKIVFQKLDLIRDNLFRKSPSEFLKFPNELLKDLQKVRNKLNRFKDKGEVIQEALKVVRERLNSQTASIFLFSKDGHLHRQKIVGVDVNGDQIDDKWFEDENYVPGESFTGQAALSQEDGFGKPQSANDLSEIPLDPKSQEKYSGKLGGIYSAIAVPLDGQNKTYGVLEVINKIDPIKRKIIPNSGFSQEEIHWLYTIGSSVASAISNLRKKRQVKLLADLSDALVGYRSNLSDIQDAYKTVVNRLVSDDTAFEVCILRVKNENRLLEVVDKAGVERVKWDKRLDDPRGSEDGFVGDTIREKCAISLTGIDNQNIENFKNQDWIVLNQFKSFGCFPLIYKEEVVGALSLYTGYEYDFHPGCKEFLERVASLTAAFIGRVKESEVLNSVVRDLNNCPVPFDLSQLKEEELREKLDVFQKQRDTIRETLDATFGNQHQSNHPESSTEASMEIFTKYCS